MDFNDIQKVNALSSEKTAIQRASELLDQGGRITQVGVSPPMPEGTPGQATMPPGLMSFPAVTVPTSYIDYPAQMVDAIKSAFAARLQAITKELSDLGVTGMEQAQAQRRK